MSERPILYLVVCAAPPVLQAGELIELLMEDGWTVWVIATPTAASWIDRDALERQTGNPVRSERRKPDEPDLLPKADAVLVAPATFNTINKWALGISDTLALGILNEVLGLDLPILVSPCAKNALTSHPAYAAHEQTLRNAGVLLASPEVLQSTDSTVGVHWEELVKFVRSTLSAPATPRQMPLS